MRFLDYVGIAVDYLKDYALICLIYLVKHRDKRVENRFECAHGKDGFCRRNMEPCHSDCRCYSMCGDCRAYYIPAAQEPCRLCSNNQCREMAEDP